jgi:hypothetical protein
MKGTSFDVVISGHKSGFVLVYIILSFTGLYSCLFVFLSGCYGNKTGFYSVNIMYVHQRFVPLGSCFDIL